MFDMFKKDSNKVFRKTEESIKKDRELSFLYQHIKGIENLLKYETRPSLNGKELNITVLAPEELSLTNKVDNYWKEYKTNISRISKEISLIKTKLSITGRDIESSTITEEDVADVLRSTLNEIKDSLLKNMGKAIEDSFGSPTQAKPIQENIESKSLTKNTVVEEPIELDNKELNELRASSIDTDNTKTWKDNILKKLEKERSK